LQLHLDVCLAERSECLVIQLVDNTGKQALLDNLKIQQRIYNAVEPYDEELSWPTRMFCLTFPDNSASLAQFNHFVKQFGYGSDTSLTSLLRLIRTHDTENLNVVTYPQFIQFLKWSLANRPEVIEVFNRYSKQQATYNEQPDENLLSSLMDINEFVHFLAVEQKQTQM
jgi:hypothetical protein